MEKIYIQLGGKPCEVKLTIKDCTKAVGMFNFYYALAVVEIKEKYDGDLIKIHQTKDKKEKQRLAKEYSDKIADATSKITLPVKLVHYIIWRLLVKKWYYPFRKPFRSKRNMIKSILINEYNDLLYFVGNEVLHLSGYKGKKQ